MYTSLGNYSHEAKVSFNGANPSYVRFVVEMTGIEPTTYWLQISCSTSWAKEANRWSVTSTWFIVTIYKLRVLFTIVDISYLPTLGLPQAPCCPARIRTSIIWTKTRCAAVTPQDSILSNTSKTFLCLQMDSNHRTRKGADLQSAAIATMRYRHYSIF